MNPDVENVLNKAYSLIEAGQLDDARTLLKPVIEVEKNNADIWWLYAHSVTDTETARLALNNVLRIDSSYPEARDLLAQINKSQSTQELSEAEFAQEPSFVPALPSSLPGLSSDVLIPDRVEGVLSDEEGDEESEKSFWARPLFYMPLIALLIIGALAIVILRPFASVPPGTSSTLQAVEPDFGTPTVETVPTLATQIMSTQTSSETLTLISNEELASVSDGLADLKVSSSDLSVLRTSLGDTLVLSMCTTPGQELRELLPKAMAALASSSKPLISKVDAVGVKLTDCTVNTILRWLGSSVADVASFGDGSMNESEFQARWVPVIEQ
ncbi:MAG: tetratricopeptide repeat protein [Anaerolineae bacterium]